MRTAIYPGSFDPITLGHLDLIVRAKKLCDRLIVAVLVNPGKKYCFNAEERVELINKSLRNVPGIEVKTFSGLLADFVQAQNADFVVRGLRTVEDFESEKAMAWANEKLSPQLETVILLTKP